MYSTKVLAEDAMELIDHLGWDKFHVVGLSMGMWFIQLRYTKININ